jgi:hypothetical protein
MIVPLKICTEPKNFPRTIFLYLFKKLLLNLNQFQMFHHSVRVFHPRGYKQKQLEKAAFFIIKPFVGLE